MSFALVVGLAFLLAGFVKGVVGLGLPTVAIGLLATVMSPAEAAVLLIVPSLLTNIWQLLAGPRFGALLRRLWPMLAGIGCGTLAGSGLMAGAFAVQAQAGLGACLVIYAVFGLANRRLSVAPAFEPWLGPLLGTITGLITAATGVFVIPAVPYLQALELDRDDLVQAIGLSFTASTIALAAGLAHEGLFSSAGFGTSLLALAPALIGMGVGQAVRQRVSMATFRRIFFLGVLGLGAHLALHALL